MDRRVSKNVVLRAKLILTRPEVFFEHIKSENSWKYLFTYFSAILGVNALILLILRQINLVRNPLVSDVGTFVYAISLIVSGFVSISLLTLLVQGLSRVFGGKGKLMDSAKCVVYGWATPAFLFGWIMFIGWLATFYGLWLEMTGIKTLHGLSPGKSAAVMLISVAIVILAAGLVVMTQGGVI